MVENARLRSSGVLCTVVSGCVLVGTSSPMLEHSTPNLWVKSRPLCWRSLQGGGQKKTKKNSGADAKQQLNKSTSPYELPVGVTKGSLIVAVLLQVYGKRTRQEEEEEDEEEMNSWWTQIHEYSFIVDKVFGKQ